MGEAGGCRYLIITLVSLIADGRSSEGLMFMEVKRFIPARLRDSRKTQFRTGASSSSGDLLLDPKLS